MHFDFRLLRHLDKWLLLTMLVLTVLGGVMISSAAVGDAGPDGARGFVIKQFVAAAVGLVALVVVLVFDYLEFSRMSKVLYGLNVLLLAIVLAIGTIAGGAQSWIGVGGFNLQPGEVGKVLLILTLANQLSQMDRVDSIWDLILPGLHVLPLLGLLLAQPDMGTALVFVVITVAMIYMAGFPGWKLMLIGGLPIVGAVGWTLAHIRWGVSMWPLGDWQVKRLVNFVNPASDPTDSGYQVIQSKITVGSGGMWGKGLYQGTQNQLGFLPEKHTDFIFAVLVEEWGFVGGAALLVLFLFLLYRILIAAAQSKDNYGALICVGVMAMIGFHVLENVGMALGIMPVTGIPLPFISYGGSSLITNIVAIGLVLSVGMRRHSILFG